MDGWMNEVDDGWVDGWVGGGWLMNIGDEGRGEER